MRKWLILTVAAAALAGSTGCCQGLFWRWRTAWSEPLYRQYVPEAACGEEVCGEEVVGPAVEAPVLPAPIPQPEPSS